LDKQKKTAAELEEIVKQRIGAGDFRVTVHRNPDAVGTPRFTGASRLRSIAARSWPTRYPQIAITLSISHIYSAPAGQFRGTVLAIAN
jgi:hypothetical protein